MADAKEPSSPEPDGDTYDLVIPEDQIEPAKPPPGIPPPRALPDKSAGDEPPLPPKLKPIEPSKPLARTRDEARGVTKERDRSGPGASADKRDADDRPKPSLAVYTP